MVFDVGDLESFARAKQWVEQLQEAKGRVLPITLCGNKADLPPAERRVSRQQVHQPPTF